MMGPSPQCYLPSHKVIGFLIMEKTIFEGSLIYMRVTTILVMWPRPREQRFVPQSHWGSIWNLVLIGQAVLEKKIFEMVDDGPWLVSLAEQAGLSLNWSQTPMTCFVVTWLIYEPQHDKTNKMTCAPSEDSDQPGHPPSLIRVFAVRSKDSQGPKLSSRGQRKLWSDWADAQIDMSLRWAHVYFVVFVMHRLIIMYNKLPLAVTHLDVYWSWFFRKRYVIYFNLAIDC